jgi:aconitate hydratase
MTEVALCLAGPKRPQGRIPLVDAKQIFVDVLNKMNQARDNSDRFDNEGGGMPVGNEQLNCAKGLSIARSEGEFELCYGAVFIAAITSCTNTSNPAVMLRAGLLARNAAAFGLDIKLWVKTSLALGSKVVTGYLDKAGVFDDLEQLGLTSAGNIRYQLKTVCRDGTTHSAVLTHPCATRHSYVHALHI